MFFTHFACKSITLVSPLIFLKGNIGPKWVNISDAITTHAIRLQYFRTVNYLHVVFLEKQRRCCSWIWKGSFKWFGGEKCIDIEIPAEASETIDSTHCAKVNSPYDLADIITDRRTVSSLSSNEKYGYLTKHYCPSDEEFLF